MSSGSRLHFSHAGATSRRIIPQKIVCTIDCGQFDIVRLGIQQQQAARGATHYAVTLKGEGVVKAFALTQRTGKEEMVSVSCARLRHYLVFQNQLVG
jgi:hypothetical protein